MQELEKIIEKMKEIKDGNRKEKIYTKYPPNGRDQEILNAYSQGYEDGTDNFYNAIVDNIRKHMNDGWIPVEERMPEDGTYLCTLKGELCGIEEPFTGMCGIENGIWDEPDCVIAWRPLPEPYIPRNQNKLEDHYPDRAGARSLNAKK